MLALEESRKLEYFSNLNKLSVSQKLFKSKKPVVAQHIELLLIEVPGLNPAYCIPLTQLPACAPARQLMMTQVFGSLPPMCKTQIEFLASSFGLIWPSFWEVNHWI